ncbi:hypothetical protein [Acinetobacter populi]|jgi:TPR repeat protein|uniref:Sel1 repeat family protein n=1 Tax=Acinetobacter populi TaxID=1582270 RepID=A0A1Z9YZG4_9GAMM|nr:hypothetical protein [Acinetobacter populi]MCH4247388.1 hypothetical protein [Acinetobacter populi]OUY07598.1 hypothetical protein CAP51_07570 [Acinetobacter populi]
MKFTNTAIHQLEHLYSTGVNTVQTEMDYRNGISQLETAARAGHGKAAMFLSQLYYQGFRVERDSLKAQYWQDLACQEA